MRHGGAFAAFRIANRRKLLILTYHRFSHGDEPAKTSAAAFTEQLAYLRAHYTIVPLSSIARGDPPPPGSVAITIDDGYRDAYDVAYPILRRFDASATIFVVTDFIDGRDWLWTDKVRFIARRAEAARMNEALKTLPPPAR